MRQVAHAVKHMRDLVSGVQQYSCSSVRMRKNAERDGCVCVCVCVCVEEKMSCLLAYVRHQSTAH